ncbi:uncharacterized protein LOC132259945 [Phlebotomus argentipes]|uniref:uncharacterized protein LOC132259945 n=1 Tax=Phlebotomus argentipes TaxID=94469 RepID=UPI002892E10B|nr:uncharacterized protein LOC132259945 [Phlebotomus argentipes]
MRKTVCTVVFLSIAACSLVCVRAYPTPSALSAQSSHRAAWINICGQDRRLNTTTILKGKQQKLSLHKALNRSITHYRNNLAHISRNLWHLLRLDELGDVQPYNFPEFHRAPKAIHQRLQIYVAVFDELHEKEKGKTQQYEEDQKAAENLKSLRICTQKLLCMMEDMFNGTDMLRMKNKMKHISVKAMREKLEIINRDKLEKSIKRALIGIGDFSEKFQEYIEKRYHTLNAQVNKRQETRLENLLKKCGGKPKGCDPRERRKIKKLRQQIKQNKKASQQ